MPGGYVCDGGYGAIDDGSLAARLDDMKAAGANAVRTWFFQSYSKAPAGRPSIASSLPRASAACPSCRCSSTTSRTASPRTPRRPVTSTPAGFAVPARATRAASRPTRARSPSTTPPSARSPSGSSSTKPRRRTAAAPRMRRRCCARLRARCAPSCARSTRTTSSRSARSARASAARRAPTTKSLHEVVDVCEVHDYNAAATAMPGDAANGFAERLRQCDELGKPIFVGESGIVADVGSGGESTGTIDATTLARRGQFFAAKIAGQLGAGMDGYLIWDKILEASSSPFNLNSGRYGIGRFGVDRHGGPGCQRAARGGPRFRHRGWTPVRRARSPTPPRPSPSPQAATGAGFRCRVDLAAYAPCTSPHTTAVLARGEHGFEVRATYPTGTADPTPARRRFTLAANGAPVGDGYRRRPRTRRSAARPAARSRGSSSLAPTRRGRSARREHLGHHARPRRRRPHAQRQRPRLRVRRRRRRHPRRRRRRGHRAGRCRRRRARRRLAQRPDRRPGRPRPHHGRSRRATCPAAAPATTCSSTGRVATRSSVARATIASTRATDPWRAAGSPTPCAAGRGASTSSSSTAATASHATASSPSAASVKVAVPSGSPRRRGSVAAMGNSACRVGLADYGARIPVEVGGGEAQCVGSSRCRSCRRSCSRRPPPGRRPRGRCTSSTASASARAPTARCGAR